MFVTKHIILFASGLWCMIGNSQAVRIGFWVIGESYILRLGADRVGKGWHVASKEDIVEAATQSWFSTIASRD